MSLSTILTIVVAVILIIVVIRFVSGLLKFAIGLAIFAVAAYCIYHAFFLHSTVSFFK